MNHKPNYTSLCWFQLKIKLDYLNHILQLASVTNIQGPVCLTMSVAHHFSLLPREKAQTLLNKMTLILPGEAHPQYLSLFRQCHVEFSEKASHQNLHWWNYHYGYWVRYAVEKIRLTSQVLNVSTGNWNNQWILW